MAVDFNHGVLPSFPNLHSDDPLWLPPKPWECIYSESGILHSSCTLTESSLFHRASIYPRTTISEGALVRLVMNAMCGVQSALVSIEKVSAAFCMETADRTHHRIANMWTWSVSTQALAKLLRSLGHSGVLFLLLSEFVQHFKCVGFEEKDKCIPESCSHSLVSHAFAVALEKFLEGYISALNTLHSSVILRRSSSLISSGEGCLTSTVHSEVTLLELYLHTKELRTRIEAVGNICNLHHAAASFTKFPFHCLVNDAKRNFCNFPRGGDLLSYLYHLLQDVDAPHETLLKFLFLHACEPYFGLVRGWIFKAEIVDPYKEFAIGLIDNSHCSSHDEDYTAGVQERDSATVPCFLEDLFQPILRAGQQLRVIMKLLGLFNHALVGCDNFYGDILLNWMSSINTVLPLDSFLFNRKGIEEMIVSRDKFYKGMYQNLEKNLEMLKERKSLSPPMSHDALLQPPPTIQRTNSTLGSYRKSSSPSTDASLDGSEEQGDGSEVSENLVREEPYFDCLHFSSALKPVQEDRDAGVSPPSDRMARTHNSPVSENPKACHRNRLSMNPELSDRENPYYQFIHANEQTKSEWKPCFNFSSIQNPSTNFVENSSTDRPSETMLPPDSADSCNNPSCFDMDLIPDVRLCSPANHPDCFLPASANAAAAGDRHHDDGDECSSPPSSSSPSSSSSSRSSCGSEMPVDFLMRKIFVEEIRLQYKYVSHLAIRLLEDGFCLRQHLEALRRYHFMERADWADLFARSLLRRRLPLEMPEIEALLETSIRRSGCVSDPAAGRLYTYRRTDRPCSPAFEAAVSRFDFVGLGYEVDWPVAVIVSPTALDAYAQVFSFLIQVRLSCHCLTDISSALEAAATTHVNKLLKIRHRILHFVLTLQQHVHLQLLTVLWRKFTDSLEHEARDMMDLRSMHMEYLADALDVCFLSERTREVGRRIRNVLQTAFDLKMCFTAAEGSGHVLLSEAALEGVEAAFVRNLTELYVGATSSDGNPCLSLLWRYLNFNNHYSP